MVGPRDIQHKDEEKVRHLTNLQIAFATLREVMHMADGTNAPGEHQEHNWASQHMVTASIYLDIAQMFAEKAVTRR